MSEVPVINEYIDMVGIKKPFVNLNNMLSEKQFQ